MTDITEVFDNLLATCGSVDIAEAEFKRLIYEDSELKEAYAVWCDENGSSEKRGFLDYADEYMDSRDSIWDNLHNEYD